MRSTACASRGQGSGLQTGLACFTSSCRWRPSSPRAGGWGLRPLHRPYSVSLLELLRLLRTDSVYYGTPADALRAGPLRPEVVLDCLRLIVREEAAGEGAGAMREVYFSEAAHTHAHAGLRTSSLRRGPCAAGRRAPTVARTEVLLMVLACVSADFTAERAAISEDVAMQTGIAASLEQDIKAFSIGEVPPPEGRRAWRRPALLALAALQSDGLAQGVTARAQLSPALLPALLASLDRLLAAPLPEADTAAEALTWACSTILKAFVGHTAGRAPLFRAASALTCLAGVSAAGIAAIPADARVAPFYASLCHAFILDARRSLDREFQRGGSVDSDTGAGLFLAALRATEAFVRLAPHLPGAPGPGGAEACLVPSAALLAAGLAWLKNLALPAPEYTTQAAMDMATGAVESLVKHGLALAAGAPQLAAPEPESRVAAYNHLEVAVGMLFQEITRELIVRGADPPLEPARVRCGRGHAAPAGQWGPSPAAGTLRGLGAGWALIECPELRCRRRWRGLALALFSAQATLLRAREAGLGSFAAPGTQLPFQLEAGCLLQFRELRRLALASEAGVAAMLQMFDAVLVSEGPLCSGAGFPSYR